MRINEETMNNNLITIECYLYNADMVRTYQTKWVGMFNRPQALNRLREEVIP